MRNKKETIAIVPGSFDPITYGHIDIVKRALMLYDKVFLSVMINPNKEYMFTIDERVNIARAALSGIKNVEVISSEGMLWQLAKDMSASAIVKGYRNDIDLEYEKKMEAFNSEHYPYAKTVLLKADTAMENISSTVVRNRILQNQSLDGFLPESATKEIKKIIKSKYTK